MLPVADCIIVKLKAKQERRKKKNDYKGRDAVRYSSCQAGTGSDECVGKNICFFGRGEAVTVDVVFVVLSVCCLVLLTASLFTVQFLNRWRPVSWWSWEEVEEGSCWAEEVECAFDVGGVVEALRDSSSLDYLAGCHNQPCCLSQAAEEGFHLSLRSPSRSAPDWKQ